jgi:hypothetical protein
MSTVPLTGGTELTSGQAIPETTVNENIRRLDSVINNAPIEDRDLATPPGTCGDGAAYLVAASPTGLWAGQAGKLAVAIGANAANGWYFITIARHGYRLYVKDEQVYIWNDGTNWIADRGTAFPGTPSFTGQRFFRSDRGIEYYYDGTRWLSTTIYTLPVAVQDATFLNPVSATGTFRTVSPFANLYDIYVERVFTESYLTSATTSSNYFTIQFSNSTAAAAGVNMGSSISLQNDTQNSWTHHQQTVNATVASTVNSFSMAFTRVGTGTAYILGTVQFRLIG